MRKITVDVIRTTQIEVIIDESIVDKKTLGDLQYAFDESLFDFSNTETNDNEDNYEDVLEIAYLNYAKHAAMEKLYGNVEFINLDRGHTKAKVLDDNFKYEFYD